MINTNKTSSSIVVIGIDAVSIMLAVLAGVLLFDATKSNSANEAAVPDDEIANLQQRIAIARTAPKMEPLDSNWMKAEMIAEYMGAELEYADQERKRDAHNRDDSAWYGVLTGTSSKSTIAAGWVIHRVLPSYPVAVRFKQGKAVLTISVLGSHT